MGYPLAQLLEWGWRGGPNPETAVGTALEGMLLMAGVSVNIGIPTELNDEVVEMVADLCLGLLALLGPGRLSVTLLVWPCQAPSAGCGGKRGWGCGVCQVIPTLPAASHPEPLLV